MGPRHHPQRHPSGSGPPAPARPPPPPRALGPECPRCVAASGRPPSPARHGPSPHLCPAPPTPQTWREGLRVCVCGCPGLVSLCPLLCAADSCVLLRSQSGSGVRSRGPRLHPSVRPVGPRGAHRFRSRDTAETVAVWPRPDWRGPGRVWLGASGVPASARGLPGRPPGRPRGFGRLPESEQEQGCQVCSSNVRSRGAPRGGRERARKVGARGGLGFSGLSRKWEHLGTSCLPTCAGRQG